VKGCFCLSMSGNPNVLDRTRFEGEAYGRRPKAYQEAIKALIALPAKANTSGGDKLFTRHGKVTLKG